MEKVDEASHVNNSDIFSKSETEMEVDNEHKARSPLRQRRQQSSSTSEVVDLTTDHEEKESEEEFISDDKNRADEDTMMCLDAQDNLAGSIRMTTSQSPCALGILSQSSLDENTPIDWETMTAAEINDFIQKEPNAKKIRSFIDDMIDKNYLTKAHDKNVARKKYETQLKQLSEDALDYAREALEREFRGRRAPKRKLQAEPYSGLPSPQKRSTVSFVTATSENMDRVEKWALLNSTLSSSLYQNFLIHGKSVVTGNDAHCPANLIFGIDDLVDRIQIQAETADTYGSVNISDIILTDSLIENDVIPATINCSTLLSFFTTYNMSIYVFQFLLWIECLGNESDKESFEIGSCFDFSKIAQIDTGDNFSEIMKSFQSFIDSEEMEIFVLQKEFPRKKCSIMIIFRKFPMQNNDVALRYGLVVMYKKSKSYLKNCSPLPVDNAESFSVTLELMTNPDNLIDFVETSIPKRTQSDIISAFSFHFSRFNPLGEYELYFVRYDQENASTETINEEILDRFWEGLANNVPVFRILVEDYRSSQVPYIEDSCLPEEPSPEIQIEELMSSLSIHPTPAPVFPSQIMIAETLLAKTKSVIPQFSNFTKLDFLIFVPKYNTLKQQTIDRLGRFNSLVHGLTESDLANRVLLYPVQDKHKITTKSYADRIVAEENTLFLIIVDECHFAPTINAIPLLHDVDVVGRANVLVLMVSATPYNVLSKQSKIRRENVIDWMDILRDKTKKDTYIGFEYYARSITFSFYGEMFRLDQGDNMPAVSINLSWREFASFPAVANAINSELKRKGVNFLTFSYSKKNKVYEINSSSALPVTLTSNTKFFSRLGFSHELLNILPSVPCRASNPITIDDDTPLNSQLVRTDRTFDHVRDLLVNTFPYLSNSSQPLTDELIEDNDDDISTDKIVKKRKKRARKTLQDDIEDFRESNTSSLYDSFDNAEMEVSRGDGIDSEDDYPPAAPARNGFIIVLDYLVSICFYSVAYDINHHLRGENEFDEEMARLFLDRLYKCCTYYDEKEFFNLTQEASCLLDEMASEAIKETKRVTSRKQKIIPELVYIMKEKRKYIGKETAETETWYTETDRIIYKLLNPSNAPAMVLLRCYDNDENRSMQKILRNALRVCKLFEPGTNIPACSVIGDISRTRIIETIEPEYRSKKVTHAMFGECIIEDIPKLRARTFDGNNGNGGLKITDDLKYEDLNGIRCLLILCEKGRMGDTFPPSLSVLDFRLRTCGNGAGFIQEMGRMCRYPKYDKSKMIPYKPEFLVDPPSFPFGCLVMINGDELFGVSRNPFQLKRLLSSLTTSFADVTAHNITLYPLMESLPYALIYSSYRGAVEDAIDLRESSLFKQYESLMPTELENKRKHKEFRILTHFACPGSLDTYLDQKFKTISNAFDYSITKKSKHYDLLNTESRETFSRNRLLLQAECQIGKTGAFLAFLSMVNGELGQNIPPNLPPMTRDLARGAVEAAKKGYRWYLPYWKNLHEQQPIPYELPKIGKYHEKILEIRALCLAKAIQQENSSNTLANRYISELKRSECILFTELENTHLENLNQIQPPSLAQFLNWDGRMTNFQDLITKYCSELQANPRHFYHQHSSCTSMMFWESDDVESGAKCLILNDDEEEQNEDDENYGGPKGIPLEDDTENTGRNNISFSARSLLGGISRWQDVHANADIEESLISIYTFQCRITAPRIALERIKTNIPRKIKNWIFTPSFAGRSNLMEKLLVRKDSFYPLVPWDDYFQVLVVRESQFDEYKKYFGHEYIVIGMPESPLVPFPGEKGQGDIVIRTITAHEGGIGLARRFIQFIARHYFKLSQIWMLDDNIKDCYQLSVPRNNMPPTGLTYRKVSFAEVMTSIEAIVSPTNDQEPQPGSQAFMDLQYIKQETDERYLSAPDTQVLLRTGQSVIGENNPQTIRNLSDFVGHEQQYGIIGINRCLTQRQVIKEPVKVTHSIYSFFLLNLTALEEHQLYYSPRPIWEDVEMNHMIERKGLLCCKLQAFVHYKPPHGLTRPSPLPPLPPPQPDFPNNYRDELKACVFSELVYHRMNELDKAKEIALSYRLKIDGKEDNQCLVLFVHDHHPDIRSEIKYRGVHFQQILLILRQDAELMEIQEDKKLKVTELIIFEVEDDGIVDSSYRIYRLHRL